MVWLSWVECDILAANNLCLEFSTESALAERESDLDGLRATNAQLRFELEEMRQRASADVRDDTEDVENDDKENAICENAADTPVHIEQHRHVSPLKERVEDISDASAPVVEGDGNGDDEETHERDTDDWNTVVPAPPTPLRRSPLRQMSDNHDFIDDDDMVPAEFNAIKRHHNNYDAAPPVGPKVVHVRRENVNECKQQ